LNSSSRSKSRARSRRQKRGRTRARWFGERGGEIVHVAIGIMLIFGAGIILASGMQRWVSTAPLFRVEEIRVTGLVVGGREEVVRGCDEIVGSNIFSVDLDSLTARVRANPRVRDVQAVRRLPNTIELRIDERSPVALVNWGDLYEIDKEGIVLPPQASRLSPDLPIVSGIEAPRDDPWGRRLQSIEAEMVLDLLNAMAAIDPLLIERTSEIAVDAGTGVTLTMTKAGQQIHLGMGDFRKKLLRLARVTREVAAKRRSPQAFDLRFRDQVVVKF
jgi:cell division protein FtsQ